jgi:hypothetical protein
MFARGTLEAIRPLETIGTGNLHLPPVIRLGTYNRNPPVPWPIRQYVLNGGNDKRPQRGIARVVHLHCHHHVAEHTIRANSAANVPPPRGFKVRCPAQYGVSSGLWRDQPLFPSYLANVATPTGDVRFRLPPFSRPNSNCKSGTYTSPQTHMPPRPSYANGVGRIGIGSTSQNGCCRPGAFP